MPVTAARDTCRVLPARERCHWQKQRCHDRAGEDEPWFAAWETLQFVYELVDAGDRVVVLLDTRLRGRSSGIEVEWGKHAFVTTFRDGLILHNKLYTDHTEALEAAGLAG